jgi:hypothetical protein
MICSGRSARMQFLGALAWVIVFSTLGGYGLYTSVLYARRRANRSLIYLAPPITLLLAQTLFGQLISLFTAVGFLLCLAGVYLVRGDFERQGLGTEDA